MKIAIEKRISLLQIILAIIITTAILLSDGGGGRNALRIYVGNCPIYLVGKYLSTLESDSGKPLLNIFRQRTCYPFPNTIIKLGFAAHATTTRVLIPEGLLKIETSQGGIRCSRALLHSRSI